MCKAESNQDGPSQVPHVSTRLEREKALLALFDAESASMRELFRSAIERLHSDALAAVLIEQAEKYGVGQ